MYNFLGLCLALATLFVLNSLGSVMAIACWFVFERLPIQWNALARARFLFALRIFPVATAIVWTAVFMIPAYLIYEPTPATEAVSTRLAILAVLSALGIVLTLRRVAASFRETSRLVSDWLSNAEPVCLGITIPTYRIDHSFPVMAVVGVVRPRLFVGRQVLDSLSSDELRAAVIHEAAHLAAHDNFKRIVVNACSDLSSLLPRSRSLDRAWATESEAAADDHAARTGPAVPLDLASALIKIARMVPENQKQSLPSGAYLGGDSVGEIAWRVQRLARLAGNDKRVDSSKNCVSSIAKWASVFACICFLISAGSDLSILAKIHAATEYIVSAL